MKFFIKEGYTRDSELDQNKPFCQMMNKVFSILWRKDELGMAAPWVNIDFVQKLMKSNFPYDANHDAVAVLRTILENIAIELIPKELVARCMERDRTDDDIEAFHDSGIVNKSFSFLQVKVFKCAKGHETRVMSTSIGLKLRKRQKDEKLLDIIDDMFAP